MTTVSVHTALSGDYGASVESFGVAPKPRAFATTFDVAPVRQGCRMGAHPSYLLSMYLYTPPPLPSAAFWSARSTTRAFVHAAYHVPQNGQEQNSMSLQDNESSPNANSLPHGAEPSDRTGRTGSSRPPEADGLDGLNLESLRLSQDFELDLGVAKVITTVPVRKPSRHAFVRVHPDEKMRIETLLLDIKEEGEVYVVSPAIKDILIPELVPKVIHTCIDRQGVVFLWPIRLPGPDGRLDQWTRSAHRAAESAMSRWVSVRSNMALGAYEVCQAAVSLPDPEWPDLGFQDLFKIAFRDHFLNSQDHPVVRRILGRA